MRELPVYGSFDLVCCLDDAMNYLHTQAEVEQTLRGLAANLSPDGILIFDSDSLVVYNGFFADHVEVEANGRRIVWEGLTGGQMEEGEIAEATLRVEPMTAGAGPTIEPTSTVSRTCRWTKRSTPRRSGSPGSRGSGRDDRGPLHSRTAGGSLRGPLSSFDPVRRPRS